MTQNQGLRKGRLLQEQNLKHSCHPFSFKSKGKKNKVKDEKLILVGCIYHCLFFSLMNYCRHLYCASFPSSFLLSTLLNKQRITNAMQCDQDLQKSSWRSTREEFRIETWFDLIVPPSHSGAYTCTMESRKGSSHMGSWEFAISHISIAASCYASQHNVQDMQVML